MATGTYPSVQRSPHWHNNLCLNKNPEGQQDRYLRQSVGKWGNYIKPWHTVAQCCKLTWKALPNASRQFWFSSVRLSKKHDIWLCVVWPTAPVKQTDRVRKSTTRSSCCFVNIEHRDTITVARTVAVEKARATIIILVEGRTCASYTLASILGRTPMQNQPPP